MYLYMYLKSLFNPHVLRLVYLITLIFKIMLANHAKHSLCAHLPQRLPTKKCLEMLWIKVLIGDIVS